MLNQRLPRLIPVAYLLGRIWSFAAKNCTQKNGVSLSPKPDTNPTNVLSKIADWASLHNSHTRMTGLLLLLHHWHWSTLNDYFLDLNIELISHPKLQTSFAPQAREKMSQSPANFKQYLAYKSSHRRNLHQEV